MENEPEVIRQEMQETRNALTEKLEALEQHVMDTVQSATSAVTDTVETVKEAVDSTVNSVKDTIGETVSTVKGSIDGTVDSVKETFDVPRQIFNHPWVIMGGAVCAGYLSGRLMHVTGHSEPPHSAYGGYGEPSREPEPRPARSSFVEHESREEPAASSVPRTASSLASMFEPEIDKLKGVAIGAVFNLLKGMLKQWVPPSMESQFEEVIDNVTSKIGGKPMQGSLMDEYKAAVADR